MSENNDFFFGVAETSNTVLPEKQEHQGKGTQKAARQFAKNHPLVAGLDALIQEQSNSLKKLKEQREKTFGLLFDSYLSPANRSNDQFVADLSSSKNGEEQDKIADSIIGK